MSYRRACAVAALLLAAAPHAQAQLVGNEGWTYSPANRSFHAQGQILHRQQQAAAAASAGAGSAIINSSTTVGNIDQISQILAAGATGNVNTNTSQSSSGSQSSNATNNGTTTGSSSYNNGVQP